jgi:hypothetical protein
MANNDNKIKSGGARDFYGRDERGEDQTSHGHSGDTKAPAVPGHKSYGSSERDEVGGGPAGRGNDGAATVNTGRDWGRGDKQEGDDSLPEAAKPVADKSGAQKNAFSKS